GPVLRRIKCSGAWPAGLLRLGLALVLVLGLALPPPDAGAAPAGPRRAVVALGRLEPGDGVVELGAGDGRLLELKVGRGDTVHAGDVVALLDTVPQLAAARDARRAALDRAKL